MRINVAACKSLSVLAPLMMEENAELNEAWVVPVPKWKGKAILGKARLKISRKS